MTEHLTQRQLEDYRLQQLRVAELLSVSEHLGECETCRRRMERSADGDAAFLALRSEVLGATPEISAPRPARSHLSAEQTALYVDGDLSGEALQTVADHLTFCERCALAVDDLREFSDRLAPSLEREYQPADSSAAAGWWRRTAASLTALLQASPRPAFGSALAFLLLATAAGWLVWRAPQAGGPKQELAVAHAPSPEPAPVAALPAPPAATPAAAPKQPPPAPVVAQLNDGGGLLALDRSGRLSGAEGLPPAYRAAAKQALAGGRLGRSSQLAGLARPPSSLMSSDQKDGSGFSVIGPDGSVLLTDRPTFRWSPLEGATGYVVEVYDDKYNPVATSPQLAAHEWAATRPLPRGKVYSWQVKAVRDGQEITAPIPPAPQARFRVLDQTKANELERARRAYRSSHLTLGLLYAEAGLLQEAEQELRKLRKANPDSEVARRLLRQVQALRRRGA